MAITRAKESLTICHARQRMLYGRTNASLASRLLRELPADEIVKKGGYSTQARSDGFSYGARQSDFAFRPAPKISELRPDSVKAKQVSIDLNKGDMVQHTAFGRGMVLSVLKMGGDALLEIAFDQTGTKKLMAKSASAHMKKL